MTDFDYDVMQKKRTAAGAYHRKGGSKSKKCSLPSDNLTEAQKRKLNGPVTTVNLNQPIRWQEFKALNSDSLKKSYLINLLNTYKPTANMIGDMMGVSGITVRKEMRRLGLPVGKKGGDQNSPEAKAKKAMWAAFCNGVVGGGDDPNLIKNKANEQIEAPDEQIEEPAQIETDEPQITCYDPEAEAEERAKERLESIKAQGVSQHSADENVAENERNEPEYGETEAEEFSPIVEVKEEPSPMRSLSAEYEGDAEMVYELMGRLAQMFYGDKVKVKLSIEVVE